MKENENSKIKQEKKIVLLYFNAYTKNALLCQVSLHFLIFLIVLIEKKLVFIFFSFLR